MKKFSALFRLYGRCLALGHKAKAERTKKKLVPLAEQMLAPSVKEYEDTYRKLLTVKDAEEKKELLKKERRLGNLTTNIKKVLGVLATDPCPYISENFDCRTCTKCSLSVAKYEKRGVAT